jgi:hypothetical protein
MGLRDRTVEMAEEEELVVTIFLTRDTDLEDSRETITAVHPMEEVEFRAAR